MDGIEVARRKAAAAHDAVVAAGVDPWDPTAVATAAAGSMDIDVEPIASGSPLLAGGRAHFDPFHRTIRHEDGGGAFDQAFLIAHEVGHASLGDDAGEHVAREVDPSRPAEPAPVGEDRVVDYSRRQRREMQMDLFARELILPRSRARALHLAGMTASEVADRLRAPFDAVAQQMLDALLLPQIAADPPVAAAGRSASLNHEQRAAAAHRGAPYVLEAGPGTGKTQTLVGRVASLIADGVDARSILVLTFSNKAAAELADRVAAAHPEAASAMWIGTFHAFGLDLVRRMHAEFGFASEPRLMDRSEAIALLDREYLALGLVHHEELWDPARPLRDMLGAVSRSKDEVADADRFTSLAHAMLDDAIGDDDRAAAERCAEVAKVYRRYEELKRLAGAVDFGDLVSLPVELMDKRPDIASTLRDTYAHVLVDEYQDVNRGSVRLLRHITDRGRGLWVVGDSRQAIYRFRGASSFNMSRFATVDFPGAATGRLLKNYRSSAEIVDAFSNFGQGIAAGDGDARLVAERATAGQAPMHITFGDNDDEADALAERILSLEPLAGLRGQAVLCPGNDRLSRIGSALERRGIPVLHLGNIFERPEVKDLLAMLSLLVDRRAAGLVRRPTLAGLGPAGDLAAIAATIAHLRDSDAAALAWTGSEGVAPSLDVEDRDALARVAAILDGFGPDDPPWEIIARTLLDRTRTAALLHEDHSVKGRGMGIAIWQFMGFVRAERRGPGRRVERLLNSIRRLVQLADDRDLRHLPLAAQGIDAVRLMTIHASKGLEFPAVHVMGLNANSLPTSPRRPSCPVPDGLIEGATVGSVLHAAADHSLEQECLFYVATSRARDRLTVYSATRDAGGRKRSVSPFVARLGPTIPMAARSDPERPRDPELDPLPIRITPPVVATAAQIDLHSRCPRRFLYTHVLGLGGHRTPTTLSMMHDVVRQVVDQIARSEPSAAAVREADAAFAAAWSAGPLCDDEHLPHRGIAHRLVRRFAETRLAGKRVDAPRLHASVGRHVVTARADDVVATVDGRRAVRLVRTGRTPYGAGLATGDAAFLIAATSTLPGCAVEIMHLGDDTPAIILAHDAKALARRQQKLTDALDGIAAGRFPPERSERTCPTCPHFFLCGDIVPGSLEKNL